MQQLPLPLDNLPNLPPIALTIGNYDGVHLGHRAMIDALCADARAKNLAAAVMIFEPQPREFFAPENPPARLSNLSEKAALLADLGVQYLLVAHFDEDFRALTAADFADLLKKLNVQHLVLGDDFRFGQGRVGDKAFLAAAGFSVDNLHSICHHDQRISSTLVREHLAKGELSAAKQLLGRDYAITGVVEHGDKIGRTLDFPTANIALNRSKPALHGVFAADVFLENDDWQADCGGVAGVATGALLGAVSIGTRPSVAGKQWRLEVHLPQFAGDLYGKRLTVRFLHHLHGERHYADLVALKAGIAQDIEQILQWRKSHL